VLGARQVGEQLTLHALGGGGNRSRELAAAVGERHML
jgi:hypothetical protein